VSFNEREKVNVLSQQVLGRIMNYRIGIRTQMSRECLVQFTDVVSSAQAGHLIGRKIVWKGEKKQLTGRIVGFHGKNGAVRVKFKRGVPGQALGTMVELVG
jgi:large subunit ribosomal protein L35Ae